MANPTYSKTQLSMQVLLLIITPQILRAIQTQFRDRILKNNEVLGSSRFGLLAISAIKMPVVFLSAVAVFPVRPVFHCALKGRICTKRIKAVSVRLRCIYLHVGLLFVKDLVCQEYP